MINTDRIVRNPREEIALNASPFCPCRSKSVPAKGVSLVVSLHVVVGCRRGSGRVDARPHGQACHRRFCPADFLDGARQGSKDRMGAAAAGALPCASCGCNDADPDHRAAILVCCRDRFRHSDHGRSCLGLLRLDLRRDAGTSMVLDLDRGRPGAASSHRIRPVDLHGGERLIPFARMAAGRWNRASSFAPGTIARHAATSRALTEAIHDRTTAFETDRRCA
jgi:hypothetical protein